MRNENSVEKYQKVQLPMGYQNISKKAGNSGKDCSLIIVLISKIKRSYSWSIKDRTNGDAAFNVLRILTKINFQNIKNSKALKH